MSSTTGYGSHSLRPRKRVYDDYESSPSSSASKKASSGEGDSEASVATPSVSSPVDSAEVVSEATTSMGTDESTNQSTDEDMNDVKEATKVERQWWFKGTNPGIEKSRLPLCLVRNVTYKTFANKCDRANTGRLWEFCDGAVVVVELPSAAHEAAYKEFEQQFQRQVANLNLQPQNGISSSGAMTCTDLAIGKGKVPDTSFTANRQPTLARNPCDNAGNPWPNIVIEAAESESLSHIQNKVTSFWLASNRCEDVIVLKLGKWSSRYVINNQTPLRHLTCYHYCRWRSPQINGIFQPFATFEFGTVHRNGRQYNGCTGIGMQMVTMDHACIYANCPGVPPYPMPAPGITVDLYYVQQYIFRRQGP